MLLIAPVTGNKTNRDECFCVKQEDENDPELPYRDIAKFGIVQLAGEIPMRTKKVETNSVIHFASYCVN